MRQTLSSLGRKPPLAAGRRPLHGFVADELAIMETAARTAPASLDAALAFHHASLEATGNEPLSAMSDAIAATRRWTVKLPLQAHPHAQADALSDHKAVFDAIERRDQDDAR